MSADLAALAFLLGAIAVAAGGLCWLGEAWCARQWRKLLRRDHAAEDTARFLRRIQQEPRAARMRWRV